MQQPPEVHLEREGDGRYMVRVGTHLRAGTVLGGNGKWCAEAGGGFVLGYFPTRAKAVDVLVADVTDPTWTAMAAASANARLPVSWQGDLQIDRAQLRHWAGSTDFLWMLRENGTNMAALDVEWTREDMGYRLDLYDHERIAYKMFHICARTQPGVVKPITSKKARELLARPARFAIDNGRRALIQRPGDTVLGTFEVTGNALSSRPDAVVTVRLVSTPAAKDYPALRDAANRWLCHYAGTWFATPKAVRVVHEDAVLSEFTRVEVRNQRDDDHAEQFAA